LKILGTLNTVSTVQWYEFTAEPKAELVSEAHGTGSLESLTLCSGVLTVIVGDETQYICKGDTLRFRTDVAHRLKNEGKEKTRGFMVNLL
jgi:mannose-6-phosphate isomerase-like protein (cupin superfamily)